MSASRAQGYTELRPPSWEKMCLEVCKFSRLVQGAGGCLRKVSAQHLAGEGGQIGAPSTLSPVAVTWLGIFSGRSEGVC